MNCIKKSKRDANAFKVLIYNEKKFE